METKTQTILDGITWTFAWFWDQFTNLLYFMGHNIYCQIFVFVMFVILLGILKGLVDFYLPAEGHARDE
jgi:hypothetical protein